MKNKIINLKVVKDVLENRTKWNEDYLFVKMNETKLRFIFANRKN